MTQLNRQAYEALIEEDLAYLEIYSKPGICRNHIKQVLIDSVELIYGKNKHKTQDNSNDNFMIDLESI